jgi:hypothetical protein
MLLEKTLSGAGQFTDWKYVSDDRFVDLSISGTFSATITLQRKFTKYGDVVDYTTFAAEEETYFYVPTGAYYRVGIKSGDYSSGDAKIKFSV